jgi:hypothetical protein
MQDLKLGTEVVHHHGKQTETQALSHFHDELKDLRQQMSGNDAAVSKNLSHYNFRKLDETLHKPHNGAPAELDPHLHASAVYKIDGRMQLVFTDDLYNGKSKDHTKHAYTINEKTGKIDAEFDIRESKTHEKVLVRHKEHGENQTSLTVGKSGDTTVLKGPHYTEYQTPDGRIIKTNGALPTIHNPGGPTENYTREPGTGNILHNVQNEKGALESRGGKLDNVSVSDDGTVTTTRTTGDFSTTTYPNGRRVERDGSESSGNIVRITEHNGKSARLTWDSNTDTPQAITFTSTDQKRCELTKAPGFASDNMYQSSDGLCWKVNFDKQKGTIDYNQATAKEIDDNKIQPPSNYRYEAY